MTDRDRSSSGESLFEQAVAAPMEQALRMQRGTARLFAEGLEASARAQRLNLDLTRSLLESYVQTMDEAVREAEELAEAGVATRREPVQSGVETGQAVTDRGIETGRETTGQGLDTARDITEGQPGGRQQPGSQPRHGGQSRDRRSPGRRSQDSQPQGRHPRGHQSRSQQPRTPSQGGPPPQSTDSPPAGERTAHRTEPGPGPQAREPTPEPPGAAGGRIDADRSGRPGAGDDRRIVDDRGTVEEGRTVDWAADEERIGGDAPLENR